MYSKLLLCSALFCLGGVPSFGQSAPQTESDIVPADHRIAAQLSSAERSVSPERLAAMSRFQGVMTINGDHPAGAH